MPQDVGVIRSRATPITIYGSGFMIHKIEQKQEWAVASYALHDAYTDFILSRQAMLCSPQTIRFYHFTAGKFVQYLEESGITTPSETSARHIRAYLSLLTERSLSDSYIHGHDLPPKN